MQTRALQRKVFAACRDLSIDNATRRNLLLRACGKSSTSEMNLEDFKAVLKRLEELGWKPVARTKKHATASRGDVRFIHVLWRELGKVDALKDPTRHGLNRFIRSRFEGVWASVPLDVDMLRDPAQIAQVIEALKAWCERAEVVLEE